MGDADRLREDLGLDSLDSMELLSCISVTWIAPLCAQWGHGTWASATARLWPDPAIAGVCVAPGEDGGVRSHFHVTAGTD